MLAPLSNLGLFGLELNRGVLQHQWLSSSYSLVMSEVLGSNHRPQNTFCKSVQPEQGPYTTANNAVSINVNVRFPQVQ